MSGTASLNAGPASRTVPTPVPASSSRSSFHRAQSEQGNGELSAQATSTSTCDRCRRQKTRCKPIDDDAKREAAFLRIDPSKTCQVCWKKKDVCGWGYVFKKPGRPRKRRDGSGEQSSDEETHGDIVSPGLRRKRFRSSASPETPILGRHVDGHGYVPYPGVDVDGLSNSRTPSQAGPAGSTGAMGSTGPTGPTGHTGPTCHTGPVGPIKGSIFGSALNAFVPSAYHDLGGVLSPFISPPTLPLTTPPIPITLPPLHGKPPATTTTTSTSTSTLPVGHGGPPYTENHNSLVSNQLSLDPFGPTLPTIDLIGTWEDVCFFVSLFMRQQHALVPLVHRPTLASDLLHRRDQYDETFRGLLGSIVAYTADAAQDLPMPNQHHVRVVQPRAPRNVNVPKPEAQPSHPTPAPHAPESRPPRLVAARHQLEPGDEQAAGDRGAPGRGEADHLCAEAAYRHAPTNALNGHPILCNDHDGVCPFPLEVDDEYMTADGCLPQPLHRVSYMTGFNTINKVFQIVSQCLTRQRMYVIGPQSGLNADTLLEWVDASARQLRSLLLDLPKVLNADFSATPEFADTPESAYGIQQANIHITALAGEFALMDFRSTLRPSEDTRQDREETARRAYETLASVPVEYLASNGESMRGKVLRVILSLLSMSTDQEHLGGNAWDWWNMYSRVQFLQVIADLPD
ncbi:hypothetical protein EHS25_008376 [Saitozyma podzolica]|uniref:Zn(2)-C6 fungal-type domain-containing protein n=1 Tax=Saitozyma podzolica TaxID=1890683 RepID=A0A427YPF1_9TREE|nr:hypothetical protein EHS25_008376 [Saitozyma podzolica]